jgi:hypothetical protein
LGRATDTRHCAGSRQPGRTAAISVRRGGLAGTRLCARGGADLAIAVRNENRRPPRRLRLTLRRWRHRDHLLPPAGYRDWRFRCVNPLISDHNRSRNGNRLKQNGISGPARCKRRDPRNDTGWNKRSHSLFVRLIVPRLTTLPESEDRNCLEHQEIAIFEARLRCHLVPSGVSGEWPRSRHIWGAKPLNDELSALPVNAPPR